MKKSNLIVLIALAVLFMLTMAFQLSVHGYIKKGAADGVGEFVTQNREISNFTKLTIRGKIKVEFEQDTLSEISVIAPKKVMDSILTEINNDELIISKHVSVPGKDTVKVILSNHTLEVLKIDSGAYFYTSGILSGQNLQIEIKGKSKATLEVSYDLINCRTDPKAKVQLKGDAKKIDFSNTE